VRASIAEPTGLGYALRDVGRHVALAALRDEFARVVALVCGERDAARARQSVAEHFDRVATLGAPVRGIEL